MQQNIFSTALKTTFIAHMRRNIEKITSHLTKDYSNVMTADLKFMQISQDEIAFNAQ